MNSSIPSENNMLIQNGTNSFFMCLWQNWWCGHRDKVRQWDMETGEGPQKGSHGITVGHL